MQRDQHRRFLILLYFVLNISGFVYASIDKKLIFGEPSIEELNMSRWEQDTSAEAAILFEKQEIEFTVDHFSHQYLINTTYYCKLKIFKKSGLDRGTIKIWLVKRKNYAEVVKDIEGTTYNYENGKAVARELTNDLIFNEEISDFGSVTKITAPNLKEGSIFEYTYKRITPFAISSRPETWFFQGNIPFKWSEVSALIPNRFLYKIIYSGYLPLSINELKDTLLLFDGSYVGATRYHYAVKDAPAFSQEDFCNSYKDYIAKLEFEISSYKDPSSRVETKVSETWKDINQFLLKEMNFGEKLKRTSFLKEIATQFEALDTLEKVKAAFNYVSKTMKWNGIHSVYTSESLNKTFESKVGSGGQINLILVALLRNLNVNANPAIISTIDNGAINEEYPQLEKFNFCIAQAHVGGQDILMDATERFSYPGMLPYDCLSKKVFIVEKENGRLIANQPKVKFIKMEIIDYLIHPEDKEITGKFSAMYGGYAALLERNYMDKEGEAKEIEKLKKSNSDWQLENVKIDKKDSIYEPLDIKFDFSSNIIGKGNETIYFNPLFSHKYNQNPFEDTLRIYPVDFNIGKEEIVIISVKIPAGYRIENMPRSEQFVLPDKAGKFSYVVDLQDDLLKIKSQFSLNKTLFSPSEYNQLKEFYNVVVDKQAQQITLRKL